MENKEFNKNIAYKKAEKRVKEIKTYYYLVIGFLIVGYFLINKRILFFFEINFFYFILD